MDKKTFKALRSSIKIREEQLMSDTSPTVSAQSGRPFSVGATLSRTMELFTGGFVRFLVLALVPLLPLLLVELAKLSGSLNVRESGVWSSVLAFLLNPLANATILYGAIKEMRGEAFTIGQSFGVVLSRMLAIFGVTICVSLFAGIAAIALIFPAFIVICMLYVAIPSCVIEKLGVFASMGRSSDLTRGYRWPIFGLILIVWIISIVLSSLVTYMLAMAGGRPISWVLNFGWQVVSTAFSGVLVAVIYHNLRVAKEGVDVSKIANVFD
jgi:hypothetical protein